MATVVIPGKLENKSNRYLVRVNPSLWVKIKPTVEAWSAVVKQSPWWLGPSTAVKAYEEEVAYRFLAGETRSWNNGELLSLFIRLIGQRVDVDSVKSILDGIQRSQRITNDAQFRRITVEHIDGKKPSVEIAVEPYMIS